MTKEGKDHVGRQGGTYRSKEIEKGFKKHVHLVAILLAVSVIFNLIQYHGLQTMESDHQNKNIAHFNRVINSSYMLSSYQMELMRTGYVEADAHSTLMWATRRIGEIETALSAIDRDHIRSDNLDNYQTFKMMVQVSNSTIQDQMMEIGKQTPYQFQEDEEIFRAMKSFYGVIGAMELERHPQGGRELAISDETLSRLYDRFKLYAAENDKGFVRERLF